MEHMIARRPAGAIFSHKTIIFAEQDIAFFAVLQSRIHELWSRTFGSTFGSVDALTYNPTQVFQTFPFPAKEKTDAVRRVGQSYHDHRATLMVEAGEGMTKTFNRFHEPNEQSATIQTLRILHDEMDRAVLRAYGWDDLADEFRSVFLTEETEDDQTYQGRYFWPADQRDRVLARLLALNAVRHAQEVEVGLAPTTEVRRKAAADADCDQDSLDLE